MARIRPPVLLLILFLLLVAAALFSQRPIPPSRYDPESNKPDGLLLLRAMAGADAADRAAGRLDVAAEARHRR